MWNLRLIIESFYLTKKNNPKKISNGAIYQNREPSYAIYLQKTIYTEAYFAYKLTALFLPFSVCIAIHFNSFTAQKSQNDEKKSLRLANVFFSGCIACF